MSPQKALKIIFFSFFFLILSSLIFYGVKSVIDENKGRDARRQFFIDEQNRQQANVINGEKERDSFEMVNDDLKKYNTVRQETVDELIRRSKIENRRLNGLPVD